MKVKCNVNHKDKIVKRKERILYSVNKESNA